MIRPPKPVTLDKYGLSLGDWQDLLAEQGGKCPICDREPTNGRLVIDHEHVKGWAKMAPELRRLYVRGLPCWHDNYYALARGMTIAKAHRVADYLTRYADRRDNALLALLPETIGASCLPPAVGATKCEAVPRA